MENKENNKPKAGCHIRIYSENGLVFSASPNVDPTDFACVMLETIRKLESGVVECDV